ncbi:EC6 protein [Colletotrichum tofieldiae]|nr:EC6 protein [Colletotrichum tofieldiae]GKT79546.1 EC6 protein [Colletotrichum tofieldiae]
MKPTFLTIIVTLAASVAASPVSGRAIGSITVKRSELINSGLFKRADELTEDNISDSVNYILKLFQDGDKRPDAYQEEIDAADPAKVLG